MDFKELKTKTEKELIKLLGEERENLRASRFSVLAKQQKNIRGLREIKKLVARISTLLAAKKGEAVKEEIKEVSVK